jgi:predicted TIM-barrel fold metal-dependent hydrolase
MIAPDSAPLCAPPPKPPAAARTPLPAGACDSHVHVFGEPGRYPLAPGRNYTPHVCSLRDYREVMAALGIERAVLVQPSVYGTDNAALLDALREGGRAFRGVVVPAPDVSDAELLSMHEAGVRGIRLNLVNPHVLSVDQAVSLCARVASLGWHLQLQLQLAEGDTALVQALARRVSVPLVLDHLGRIHADAPPRALLKLVDECRCWVKLSAPYRVSREPHPYRDLRHLVRALAAGRPDRLLWASDWPHTEQREQTPEPAALVEAFAQWIPDPAVRAAICTVNPQALYGF